MTSIFFFFFSNCVYHCFQVVCFNILGGVTALCICHAPITQFSKIVSIEGRFCFLASLFCRLVLFVFSLGGACLRGFELVRLNPTQFFWLNPTLRVQKRVESGRVEPSGSKFGFMNGFLFSRNYLISSWVVVIKS
jgi:hypothetical protein